MRTDRIIQFVAAACVLIGLGASSILVPSLVRQSDRYALRYTDVSVEGAPPFVAIGQAIGALRGVIVDVLWIKVNAMKEEGLFYEVMALSDIITRLQPRFASVWAFHGHNMAYNISVATNTQSERWEWVQKGIRMVRERGLRYNPNDLELHKELAFWFSHKIEGNADDAHHYYKAQLTREWHYLLGQPPEDYQQRIQWIQRVADAPDDLEELKRRNPKMEELIGRIKDAFPENDLFQFSLDKQFLIQYVTWKALTSQSTTAEIVGEAATLRDTSDYFRVYDALAADPVYTETWEALVSFIRKHVLLDEYNMDPRLMYEYTRDLGPIDWRHGQAHALYWARKGSQSGERRVLSVNETPTMMNNDRLQIQAMQGLSRDGRIYFDPFNTASYPARLPDARWLDAIESQFVHLYDKYYDSRGAGGDSFVTFLENFMSDAVRSAYRRGDRARALAIYESPDDRFGRGHRLIPNDKYASDLDVFVMAQVRGQIEAQPHIAGSEIAEALYHGFLVGLGQGDEQTFQDAVQYARQVLHWFKTNEYFNEKNRFRELRIGDLVESVEQSAIAVLRAIITDRSLPIQQRSLIWSKADQYDPTLRGRVHDFIRPQLESEFNSTPLGSRFKVDELFPAPANLEQVRLLVRQEQAARERQRAAEQTDAAERTITQP